MAFGSAVSLLNRPLPIALALLLTAFGLAAHAADETGQVMLAYGAVSVHAADGVPRIVASGTDAIGTPSA